MNPVKKANLYCYFHFIGEERDREVIDLAQGHTAAPGPQAKLSPLPGLPWEVLFLFCLFSGRKPKKAQGWG